ncbi:hypothetical protein IMZ48_24835 [Candidatus Bathyarchaeota archaeon]|nr:hypothetical protein [Candidatus Bathyarchaeota archaeon]
MPTEIRLQILDEAIRIRRSAPTSPSQSKPRADYVYPGDIYGTNIYLELDDGTKNTQLSLLMANRQLRHETQYVAEQLAREPYHVDVMFVYAFGLMPTWVSLPCLPKRITKLHVHFRIFDFPADGAVPEWLRRTDA